MAEANEAAPPKPHHSGHRERLRARALAGGLGALPDYELLELYLFRSIPMRDVKPLAKSLLVRFGDLSGVLGATVAELRSVAGIGESVALDLKLLHEASVRVGREPVVKRSVITSASQLLAYVRLALANEAREQFRVLFLDKKNQLIADEVMGQGTVDHAPVYPREVMRRAHKVHNHPSGDPTPSGRGDDPAGDRGRQRAEHRRARPPGGGAQWCGEFEGSRVDLNPLGETPWIPRLMRRS